MKLYVDYFPENSALDKIYEQIQVKLNNFK